MLALATGHQTARAEGEWFVSLYGGVMTENSIDDLMHFDATFADSQLLVLTGGKEVYRWDKYLGVELEGQIGKHFGYMDHFEFNGLMTLRWHPFPWDKYLDTSFAFGNGLSYALDEPQVEIDKNDETARLLYYLMIELDFKIPKQERWSVFARLHHRSGAFGLFDGVHGGSNAITGGIKFTF